MAPVVGGVSDDTPTGALDRLPDLEPAPGETESAEVALTDDLLVKAFALAPGASVPPHDHPGSTNVFHVLRGTPTAIRDGEEETVSAPGVVVNERGAVHGLRNDGDDVALVTATYSWPLASRPNESSCWRVPRSSSAMGTARTGHSPPSPLLPSPLPSSPPPPSSGGVATNSRPSVTRSPKTYDPARPGNSSPR